MRTPLNSIIGFTSTLLMGMPGPLNEDQEPLPFDEMTEFLKASRA